MRSFLVTVLMSLALTSCVAARMTWKTSHDLPPLATGEPVSLYLTGSAPDWVREALGGLAAREAAAAWGAQPVAEIESQAGMFASYGTMVEGVRATARDLGADTIVATGTPDYDAARVVFFRLMRRAGSLSE